MEFVLRDAIKLERFVSVLQTLKPSYGVLNFMCNAEDGMVIQNLDKSHVCLCHVQLQTGWFDAFEIASPCNFAIDTATLVMMLQHLPVGHQLHWRVEEDQLLLEFDMPPLVPQEASSSEVVVAEEEETGKKKRGGKKKAAAASAEEKPVKKMKMVKKTYKLALIHFDYEQLGVPEMDSDVECTMSAKELHQLVKEMSDFGDDLTLICDQETVVVRGKDEMKEAETVLQVSDMLAYGIVEDERIEATFKTAYLSQMVTAKITDQISFELSTERPIRLTYWLGEGEAEPGNRLSFFVAPVSGE